jgi:hypothetical protein
MMDMMLKTGGLLQCLLLCIVALYLVPSGAYAAQIAGKIRVARNEVRLLLDIEAPAPKTIILTLHLPPGTKIRSCKPPFTKAVPDDGEFNWLLTDVTHGHLTVSCRLNRRIRASSISGTARYKNPSNGNMEEISLSN